MAKSAYPAQLDTDLEIPRADNNITEIGSDSINSLRDAIFSIEEAIGVNPQGNLSDLATRINSVIDENGNIRTSAIQNKGLVSLPIDNSDIDGNAAIAETKLDLDYSTSLLNSKIENVNSDIDSVRDSVTSITVRSLSHFAGSGDNHNAEDIVVSPTLNSTSNVQDALENIDSVLDDHVLVSKIGAHGSTNISVNDVFSNFSASTVQEALERIDSTSFREQETHQNLLHINAVELNSLYEGDNTNKSSASFAATIYQTDITKATNILQVMRPNVARITSDVPDLRSLDSTSIYNLRILAGGIDRTYVDVNLSSIIPTNSLDDVVEQINSVLHSDTNHYPVSAYNVCGRLVLAHNLSGYEYTLSVLTSTNTCHSVLGFSNIVGTTVYWNSNNGGAYVNGKRIVDLDSIIKTNFTLSSSSDTIELGLGDLSAFGITTNSNGRVLCHITNHGVDSSNNGTYYITSFPDTESFTLNATIDSGTFDIEILYDSLNFQNSTNGELYDVFIEDAGDGYASLLKHNRASYGVVAGIDIKTITKNFPTNTIEWEVDSNNNIKIYEDSTSGVLVNIPTGFVGEIEAFCPDNINSAIFQVTSTISAARRSITVNDFYGDDTRFYICSVHYAGNHGLYTLKYVEDKRVFGGTVKNISNDYFSPEEINYELKYLRNNGVVRGLDVISNTTSDIAVRGGIVLVNGKFLEIETQSVYVNDLSSASRLLLVDENGSFLVVDESDAGYSMEELISGDGYGDDRNVAIIAQFDTNGTSISGTIRDRRLIIGKIDKRFLNRCDQINEQIVQLRDVVSGSFWAFTLARASGIGGGNLADLTLSANTGTNYVQYVSESASGFTSGDASVTTRRFELSSETAQYNPIVITPGMTHVNVFCKFIYTGETTGPFGVSGTVNVSVGIASVVGDNALVSQENYAVVKTIYSGVLPSSSVTERYVVSVPISLLSISNYNMFGAKVRVKVSGCNYIDGGLSGDSNPKIGIDDVVISSSSYSIAGHILEQDGDSEALCANTEGFVISNVTGEVYTGTVTSYAGADGYVAFYIGAGPNSQYIAGDNDLYWNRESNKLQLGGGMVIGGQITTTLSTTSVPTGTSQTIDWNNGNVQIISLASATGDVTVTLINGTAGATYILKVIQDNSVARNISWSPTVKWPDGDAVTISTTLDAIDIISLFYDGSNYYGSAAQNYS